MSLSITLNLHQLSNQQLMSLHDKISDILKFRLQVDNQIYHSESNFGIWEPKQPIIQQTIKKKYPSTYLNMKLDDLFQYCEKNYHQSIDDLYNNEDNIIPLKETDKKRLNRELDEIMRNPWYSD